MGIGAATPESVLDVTGRELATAASAPVPIPAAPQRAPEIIHAKGQLYLAVFYPTESVFKSQNLRFIPKA